MILFIRLYLLGVVCFYLHAGVLAWPHIRQMESQRVQFPGQVVNVNVQGDKQTYTVLRGDDQGSRVIVDWSTGIISWSSRQTGACYVIGGIDSSLPTGEQLQTSFNQHNQDDLSQQRILYRKVGQTILDDAPIADELDDECHGKNIFWMVKVGQQATTTDVGKRQYGEGVCGGWVCCIPYTECTN